MLSLSNTTGGTLISGTPITFNQDFDSNSNITYSNGVITINKAGYYAIDVNAMLTATGTTTGIQLYANGVAIPKTIRSFATTAGDTVEAVINDKERVIYNFTNNTQLQLTIVPIAGETLVNIEASVYEIR